MNASSTRQPASADADPGPHRRRWAFLTAVAAATVGLDQLTKWWAVEALDDRTIHLFWTVRLNLTFNYDSAFSLVSGGPLLPLLAIAVVLVLLWTGRTVTTPLGVVSLGLVLGGALGNLADRAVRAGDGFLGGYVVDFIDAQWWPVFNVADIAVVIGALLLVLSSWRAEHS